MQRPSNGSRVSLSSGDRHADAEPAVPARHRLRVVDVAQHGDRDTGRVRLHGCPVRRVSDGRRVHPHRGRAARRAVECGDRLQCLSRGGICGAVAPSEPFGFRRRRWSRPFAPAFRRTRSRHGADPQRAVTSVNVGRISDQCRDENTISSGTIARLGLPCDRLVA